MDSYQELANAIVLQAAKDYRYAVQRLKKDPENRKLSRLKRQCERFFRSTWIKTLTTLNGPAILQQLKEETQNDD